MIILFEDLTNRAVGPVGPWEGVEPVGPVGLTIQKIGLMIGRSLLLGKLSW